jgi:hypothetical protein
MKKYIYFMMAFAASLVLVSCEGPMGPPGENGLNGTDGTNGVDGNATCLTCHNLTTKSAVTAQYDESLHAKSTTVARSTGKTCSKCHSHEGFLETLLTGRDTTAVGVPIPTRVDCQTCHGFHETLDFAKDGPDYALRTVKPVKFMAYKTVTGNLGGTGNLCVNCHQSRAMAPGDNPSDVNWNQTNGTYTITAQNTRFGPHYGPEGNIMSNNAGYKTGTVQAASHKSLGCADCHMHRPEKGVAHHKFKASVDACKKCHTTATSFDYQGKQTEIAGLLSTLKSQLIARGILNSTTDLAIPGTYPIDLAGAFWNYKMVYSDASKGIHHYQYIKAMLQQGIAASAPTK